MLTIIITIASCTEPPVQLLVTSAKQLNLNNSLESLPVMLRIYQLSRQEQFLHASFYELWKHDKKILKDNLLVRKEVYVKPNSRKTYSITRVDNCLYIGIIALFRKPRSTHWRIIKKITEKSKVLPLHIHLYVQKNSLMAAP